MDNWTRDPDNEYTGVTAQRRNRRRIDAVAERAETPAEAEITDVTEASAAPEIPETQAVSEAQAEPALQAEMANPAEEDMTTEPAMSDRTGETDAPAEPAVQRADSRVPPEARRMAAAPYGIPREGAKRPGTRPQVAPRRPELPEERRPASRQRREGPNPESLRSGAAQRERPARVNVGYAPGRMSDEATRLVPTADAARESVYGRDAKAYLEKRKQPFRMEEEKRPAPNPSSHKLLRAVVTLLVVAGLILSGWMLIKNRGGGGDKTNPEAPQVFSFELLNNENLTAPADLIFSAETEQAVEMVRLHADGDRDVETDAKGGAYGDRKIWTIKMHVETGFDGTVSLQASRDNGEYWIDTGYTAAVAVATPMGMDVPSASPEVTADPEDDDYYDVDAERSGTDGGEGTGATPAPATPAQDDAAPEAKPTEKPTEDEAEDEWDKGEPGVLYTPAPTATPTPAEAAVTATPPLAADPAPEANPDLINQTVVWTSFVKKEKDYNRLAKEQVHMPAGDEYTTKKLGVMTFRGDNFRRNAAAGTLGGTPQKMAVLWQAEAGSIRGTNTTYYGYGWTNQPVIARWSTEVRTKSNITEAKIDKSALKEVIIAGLDGAIRFLDLEDGKITRNSIKLGYPMRGTPSLHPRGYPFLTVGQFARKTKARTGKIGLRQYNLYTQKELKLIDGLDGKYHRPLNDIGSFETSALIDRESDTLIVAGTNGMLYLESLGTNFDYSLGVLQISPSIVAMSSRAKGQKSNALLAVESSPAAYDKYVYYADMGGVLRCVDTNTLRPVWAVNTGDSVMAAVALDLTPERELNLYTANMLNNRKKGNGSVQIRKYDALSGREAWCTDVGVLKSKKDKEKDNVGAKASPVIGQNGLSDLVYFTVTGLSGEGAETLGLNGETPAALIALSKDNGRMVWAFALGSRSESSPVALYDKQGNGWIIQCEQSGMVHLLDGRTGREINNLQLEGEVEASPAAYNNVVVVGTTGKGKAFVYGIEVKLDKTEETEAPAGNEEGREGETVGDEESAGEEPADDEAGMENEDGGADRHDEYEDYEDYEDYDAEDEESGDGRQ